VPARYGASRFPGKPLARETGRPLIAHVLERVGAATRVSRIAVATDHPEIAEASAAAGAEVVLTRADHPNGTSRIAEAAERLDLDPLAVIVNVQGDEPEIEPAVIDALVDGFLADPEAPMATLASPFAPGESPADPNIVKVVVNRQGRACYFSRALIPHDRDGEGAPPLKHPGCYAYRRPFLATYAALPETPLERTEKLEQLRALEHGHPIAVVQARVNHHGIDTPEQYAAFVQRWRAQEEKRG